MAGITGDAQTITTAGGSSAHVVGANYALGLATFGFVLGTIAVNPKYEDRVAALMLEQYRKDLING